MQWDEKRLLAAEVDAIHGLVPGSGDPPVLRDPTVLAVWSAVPAGPQEGGPAARYPGAVVV
ncbi:hypothetical protein C9F11_03655 [Streptomyces sp. YIM 121038]|uniref:hypothetical protein n=1 Tax=Streptomyces sp. YIM 121038 TaxID=2136401 RepID=UPI001110478F|nr:hypothetical protein [Streptomyces sp. YIM 121038]QCX74434.1 hypothetical protein C9F11_03655 [Streptomyces sp. YIM 121038]